MFDISVTFAISAFVGGLLMFLAPCTFPLIPAFLASMMPEGVCKNYRSEILIRTIVFSFGFAVVFTILGMLSGIFGSAIAEYKTLLIQIGGISIIILGLMILGVFELPFLKNTFQRLRLPQMKKGRVLRPLLLGIIFALGWSPCAGPILASILLLASQSGTVLEGGILLALFSSGLALPFILTGLLYAHTTSFFSTNGAYIKYVSIVSGALLIVLGVTLFFSQSLVFTEVGFFLYNILGIAPMCTYY